MATRPYKVYYTLRTTAKPPIPSSCGSIRGAVLASHRRMFDNRAIAAAHIYLPGGVEIGAISREASGEWSSVFSRRVK